MGDIISQLLSAVIAASAVIVVALIGLLGAQRLGIGANQERLVATLKELVEAQTKKIEALEAQQIEDKAVFDAQRAEDKKRIEALELRVDELTDLTVAQALKIRHLEEGV